MSLVITLAVVYVSPSLFPISVTTDNIVDGAVITAKLADGNVTSAKILDGNLTAVDLADGSIINVKVGEGAVTTSKIADYAVSNLKLAADAIPYNVTQVSAWTSTTSVDFVDMPDTSLDITVTRNSTLVIMFSGIARLTAADNYLYAICRVNDTLAKPATLTILTSSTAYVSYSHTFLSYNVERGTYTV